MMLKKNKLFTSYEVFVTLTNPNIHNGKTQMWTVFRRYSQFRDLYLKMYQSGAMKLIFDIPNEPAERNLSPEFIEKRRYSLNESVKEIITHHQTIFDSKRLTYYLSLFVAPIQLGDKKPPDFVMPFSFAEHFA